MNSNIKTVIIWVVLICVAVLLWTVVRAGGHRTERQITYTQFMNDVEAGKVKSVTITGNNEVHGVYQNDKEGLRTTLPPNYPDAIKRLEERGVNIEAKAGDSSGWVSFLVNLSPFILLFAFWIIASTVAGLLESLRAGGSLQWRRLRLLSGSQWGMNLAHVGIAVFVIGVTMVKGYETEREQKLAVGSTLELSGYSLRFESLQEVAGANYDATRGRFVLMQGSQTLAVLSPEKRLYRASRMPMTEAAIDRSLLRDFYVSMGEPLPDGAWAVRVHVKPFVNWIWLGCVLMALGGLAAALDARYRRVAARRASAAAAAQSA